MSHHQKGALVIVDQVPEAVEVFKIQEHVRLVHDEEAGPPQHLADDLNQLIFAAAEGGELQPRLVAQLCQL